MSEVVSPLLQWLNANPEWASAATFLISAAESVAIIGTIVPGSITMTAIGTLAGAGIIPLWSTIFWAILGAVLGDGISYWIGHYFKDRLRQLWPFRNNPRILETGEKFVHKYGTMSVFIGRFVGPVRALVPLVAGMLGMKPLQFTIANITSAIGWAPIYMLPGILLGAASLELPPDIAMHVILVLFLFVLFVVLCIWSVYKLLQLIEHQTTQLQSWIWVKLKASRLSYPITYLIKHHDPNKSHGQLRLSFLLIVAVSLFVWLAMYVRAVGADNIMVNDAVFHLFRGIRTPFLDTLATNITLLGQKQVVLAFALILTAWLLFCKRIRLALHTIALCVFAAGSVFVVKKIIQSPRPWGILNSPETYSMPSGHTTLSSVLFLGLALLIAQSVRPSRRWFIYAIGLLIALSVAVSRLYLSAHWFTDILAGWLLSSALLILVSISYLRHAEKPVPPAKLLLVSLVGLSVCFMTFHALYFDKFRNDYTATDQPATTIDMQEWWHKDDVLPTYRTSLFGFPSQPLNIEWVGNIENIRQTLLKQGWTRPPARDWVSTLHRIADISSAQYLPLISPQYLDKRPVLILTRKTGDQKKLIVIRLWDANINITNSRTQHLWVGVVSVVPRPYGWLFRKHTNNFDITPSTVFPVNVKADTWDWKTVEITHPNNTKQKIILIRQSK